MCARLQAPIVLAHGLFGFQRIGVGDFTFTSYFHGIPQTLRKAGNRVLAAQVPPIAGVALRAQRLGEQIDAIFPGEPVHLIGHSMGGLDARLLASHPEWSKRVLSLTTIGTPHLGTSLADLLKQKAGPIYRFLEKLRIHHKGFLDVTREAAAEFHRKVIVPPPVQCFCVAGGPTVDQIWWPLRRFYQTLLELEGPNDAVVSVESANAYGTILPAWPLDHFRQMNFLPDGSPSGLLHSPISFYEGLIDHLASLGFGACEEAPSRLQASA